MSKQHLAHRYARAYKRGMLAARVKKLAIHTQAHPRDIPAIRALWAHVAALSWALAMCPVQIYCHALKHDRRRRIPIPTCILELKTDPSVDMAPMERLDLACVRYELAEYQRLLKRGDG